MRALLISAAVVLVAGAARADQPETWCDAGQFHARDVSFDAEQFQRRALACRMPEVWCDGGQIRYYGANPGNGFGAAR